VTRVEFESPKIVTRVESLTLVMLSLLVDDCQFDSSFVGSGQRSIVAVGNGSQHVGGHWWRLSWDCGMEK